MSNAFVSKLPLLCSCMLASMLEDAFYEHEQYREGGEEDYYYCSNLCNGYRYITPTQQRVTEMRETILVVCSLQIKSISY